MVITLKNMNKRIKIAVIVVISAIIGLTYLFTLHNYRTVANVDFEGHRVFCTNMNYYKCIMSVKGVSGDFGTTVIYMNYDTREIKKIEFGPNEEIDEKIEIGDIKEASIGITVESEDSSVIVEITGKSYGTDLIKHFIWWMIQ